MTNLGPIILAFPLAAALAAAPAGAESPAFRYDPSRTPTYLREPSAESGAPDTVLVKEAAHLVDEVLDGPWAPLLSDYSAGQAGGVGLPQWCFDRPGDYLLALSQAAPIMAPSQRARTRRFLRDMVGNCRPTREVFLTDLRGKSRNIRVAPAPSPKRLDREEAERLLFFEAYAVWAYANAFDDWDVVRPLYEDLKRLRERLETRSDFAPGYLPDHAGPLTKADLENRAYCFRVYQALLAGFRDDYGYRGAQEAAARMAKGRPVFFYVKHLAALAGYWRLAEHFGEAEQAEWAEKTFTAIATLSLGQKSAPYLWSDSALSPEIGRLLRDAAGPWLDTLAKTNSVGTLPATDWNDRPVPGRRVYVATNPYTWHHAWGGQGEGVRPHAVLGTFLAHACLSAHSSDQVASRLDIPWCRADLYHLRKLVVVIRAQRD